MEVTAEEITAVKISRETFMEIVLEEAVSKIVDLIIDIIHYHHSFDKRSAIYIKSLNAS